MPIKNGWFYESEVMWPGQAMGLKVEEVLHESRSDFQDILVFRSSTYGTVLVLDGVIQLTERDEHAYQEMIAHLPLHCHPNPRSVLIVGGGDGGVLREVVRHAGVRRIVMCEIDRAVIEVSQKFFPETMATAFGDARLELVHDDAAEFVKRHRAAFDVVIVDSSDPVGPAESLFEPAFYASLRDALRPGGVVCTQGECVWLHLRLISTVVTACGHLFPTVEYAYTTVPSYPSGQIGFVLCSLQTAPGALRALEGEGMPLRSQPGCRGRLFVRFDVRFPPRLQLSDEQRAHLLGLLGARAPQAPAAHTPPADTAVLSPADASTFGLSGDGDGAGDDGGGGGGSWSFSM